MRAKCASTKSSLCARSWPAWSDGERDGSQQPGDGWPLDDRETLRSSQKLPVRFVAMNHKLRIGAPAQLMQVHADAFAVGIDPERDKPVQNNK